MKKLMIIAVSIVYINASAQSNISLGGTIGGNFSTLTDTANYEYIPGFNAQAFIIWGPVEHWGFSGGVQYSMEGTKYSVEEIGLMLESKSIFHYVRIPLQVNYFFNGYEDPVRPKLFLGPNIGFLAGGTNKTDLTVSAVTTSTEIDVKEYINSVDVGIQGGVGINFRLSDSGTWLNIDALFYRGLIDISDDAGADNYNQHFSLNAGITIPLGYAEPTQ